jgi:hypothetical protein
MELLYLIVVWVHIVIAATWFGAMLFEDPSSTRFMARIAYRVRGLGGLSLLLLFVTGAFLLYARGVTFDGVVSGRIFAERYGQVLASCRAVSAPCTYLSAGTIGGAWAAKLGLVVFLVGLQATVGNRPSRALYVYMLCVLTVIALSVWLVRPLV